MVDYFVAMSPALPGSVGQACDAGAIDSLSVRATEIAHLPAVEQLKSLLQTGNARQLGDFLRKTFDELQDLYKFNSVLLTANVIADNQLAVAMEVILKSLDDFPVVRLADSNGDFCVIKFDRPFAV